MIINVPKIERKAESLLRDSGVRDLPVDLEKIAKHLDVEIKYEDLDDDVSGCLVVENNKSTVVVNNGHHSNRQRFTIAHELGHYCLHVKSGNNSALFVDKKYAVHHRNADSSLGAYKNEREANLFASILLMPKNMVGQAVEEQGFDFFDESDIYLLSRKFGVSEQALGFRLARLNYEVGEDEVR